MRLQFRLTLLSDLQVMLAIAQMYATAETCCGQAFYYFGWAVLWSDVPLPAEISCGQVCNYFSQVHLWPDEPHNEASGQIDISLGFRSGWPFVRCTPQQRHLVAKHFTTLVRFTCGQMYPQKRHLVAKCVTTSVRFTCGQMYPQRMKLWVGLAFSQILGKSDLWFFSNSISCLWLYK